MTGEYYDPSMSMYMTSAENPIILGKQYFDELAEKHTIMRAWAQRVADRSTLESLNNWYGNYVNEFKALRDALLPISCEQFSAFYDYINRNFSAHFNPYDFLQVVRKFLLREKITFPPVELYTRVMAFIREVGIKELPDRKLYETQKTAMLSDMFNYSLDEVKQRALYEEYKRYYDTEVRNNFALVHLGPMMNALDVLNKTLEQKRLLQEEINAITSKIDSTMLFLSDEEIMTFIVEKSGDTTMKAKLDLRAAQKAERAVIDKTYLDRMAPLYTERGGIVGQINTLRSQLSSLRIRLNRGEAVASQIDSVNAQIATLNAAYKVVQDKLNAIDAEKMVIVNARPDLYPRVNGMFVNVTDAEFLESVIKEFIQKDPTLFITVTKTLMEDRARVCDSLMAVKMAEREKSMSEMSVLLSEYVRGRAQAELKLYEDELKKSEAIYNEAAARQKAREALLNHLQTTLQTQLEALGGVIGIWTYENKISEEAQKNPFFIKSSLGSIINSGVSTYSGNLRGRYELRAQYNSDDNPSAGVFWKGEPTGSIQACRNMLDRMAELERAQNDYDTGGGKADRDVMTAMAKRLNEMQPIYQMIIDRINSPEFAVESTHLFKKRPEWLEKEAINKALQDEYRNIYSWLEYRRQRYSDLIDRLEEENLELHGESIPDVEFGLFEDNRKLWLGVNDYLAKAMPQMKAVKAELDNIKAREASGSMSSEDHEHLKIIQAIYMNIQTAQLIFRRLEKMTQFQLQLKIHEEDKLKESFNARS
jgi:hypothetical protein